VAKEASQGGVGPRKVRFVYTRSPEYRTIAINGAWGGLTSRGEVRAHLFVEGSLPPEAEEVQLDGEGTVLSTEEVWPQDPETYRTVEREIQVSVVMSPLQALALSRWLKEKYEAWEQNREAFEAAVLRGNKDA